MLACLESDTSSSSPSNGPENLIEETDQFIEDVDEIKTLVDPSYKILNILFSRQFFKCEECINWLERRNLNRKKCTINDSHYDFEQDSYDPGHSLKLIFSVQKESHIVLLVQV